MMGTTTNGVGKVILYVISILMLIGSFVIFLHSRDIKFLIEKSAVLEYRIERLEMEATTTKLFLKQTQRLLVPDEVALLRRIPARQ